MIAVSSKEFTTHPKKYFGMAMDNEVCIRRGRNMFRLMREPTIDEQPLLEPDADFYRSITMDEVRDSVVEYMRKKHAGKK